MDILVSTLSSPVSSSGYGSAEEDHSLVVPFPELSTRRHAPLSPSSDSGSGIFSYASTSSSSLQSPKDDFLPEALGTFFGDLQEFEEELPHLDLSCGLNFSEDSSRVNDPTNGQRDDHIDGYMTDHLNDHISGHLNDPNDFDCLSDLCHYFQPEGVDPSDLDGCNYSTSIDPTFSVDLDEEASPEGPADGQEDKTMVLLLRNTRTPLISTKEPSLIGYRTPGFSTHPSHIEDPCPLGSLHDAQVFTKDVEKVSRPLDDCLEDSTTTNSNEKAVEETASLHGGKEIKNGDGNSFAILLELISRGTGKHSLDNTPHLNGPTSTGLSKREPPQPVLSRTFPRGQTRSPNAASSETNKPSRTVGDERQQSASSSSHDPTLPCPLPRPTGFKRPFSELDDHRYSTVAPDSDPAPPLKSARAGSEVLDGGTGKLTGSTRVATTGSGSRRSEKTILETFLLTTEKLYANKGSDAMLAEDRIARLYSGRHSVLSTVKSSSSSSHSTSSSSSSSSSATSSQRSSVLERLLTEGDRIKRESVTIGVDRSPTTHHPIDTTKELRHAMVKNVAPPSESSSMGSNYEQFDEGHFANDTITLQLGLLNDETNDHVWTPSSVDDKVLSNEMEAIIGQNLNPSDIWMHQYISDLL